MKKKIDLVIIIPQKCFHNENRDENNVSQVYRCSNDPDDPVQTTSCPSVWPWGCNLKLWHFSNVLLIWWVMRACRVPGSGGVGGPERRMIVQQHHEQDFPLSNRWDAVLTDHLTAPQAVWSPSHSLAHRPRHRRLRLRESLQITTKVYTSPSLSLSVSESEKHVCTQQVAEVTGKKKRGVAEHGLQVRQVGEE